MSHSDPTTAVWSGASTAPNATGLVANRGRLGNWARFITPAGLGSQYRSSPDVALTAHASGWFSKLPLHHLTILQTILAALADVAFLLRVLLGTQWGRQTTMQAAEGVHMMSLCLSSLERARSHAFHSCPSQYILTCTSVLASYNHTQQTPFSSQRNQSLPAIHSVHQYPSVVSVRLSRIHILHRHGTLHYCLSAVLCTSAKHALRHPPSLLSHFESIVSHIFKIYPDIEPSAEGTNQLLRICTLHTDGL